ncbi:MAG: hypothetical protein IIB44_08455 [Candidatus Marinimicrobia bacterium]|nr:hypothetical protein [Candidatus Neomarinimicrobiota bacterium]
MRILKKIAMIPLFLSMAISVQFTVPGCESPSDSDDDEDEITADIYTPTNDYYVKVQVIKFGLFGCAQATIEKDSQPIENADIEINDVQLTMDDFGNYSDTTGTLEYKEGTVYMLEVRVGNSLIAKGNAIMPSAPTIENLEDSSSHVINTPLNIDWKSTKNTTSVQVKVESPWPADDYESRFLSPEPSSFTIPGDVFSEIGGYSVSVEANFGIPSGITAGAIDSSLGYNIEGAAGVFIAVNVSEQLTIIIPGRSSVLSQEKRSRKKEIWDSRFLGQLRTRKSVISHNP